jgi:hypothetical protein
VRTAVKIGSWLNDSCFFRESTPKSRGHCVYLLLTNQGHLGVNLPIPLENWESAVGRQITKEIKVDLH